jgi:hypothetical protein
MPKFLAVHPMPSPMSLEEGAPIAKMVKSHCTADAYWIYSWVQLNEEGKVTKTFCEWNAKDMNTLKKLMKELEKAGLPLEGVYPMAKLEPEDYV